MTGNSVQKIHRVPLCGKDGVCGVVWVQLGLLCICIVLWDWARCSSEKT